MYMSPSKMSKILSGNRVISMQDAGEFSSKAARILSDEIFTPDCYVKFGDIFPVIHDFATRFDLEQFLVDAIHYWINKELMIDDISGRCETNEHFSPQSQILNMLCIVCSDYLAADTEDGYEVYSTLLHHNHGHYAEIFSGIRVMGTAAKHHIDFHQLNDHETIKTVLKDPAANPLGVLYWQEKHTDLYRWRAKLEGNAFLLLRNHFVLTFNTLLDGSVHMMLVRKQSEVKRFYESVAEIMKTAVCLSISEDHVQDFFARVPDLENHRVANKISAIADLSWNQPPPKIIMDFFNTITEDGTIVYISTDVLPALLQANQVLLPGVKTIDWSREAGLSYLTMLGEAARRDSTHLRIINAPLQSIVLLCDDELSLLCVVNPTNKKMKYHVVDSRILKYELEKSTARSGINTVEYMQTLLRNAQHEMQQTNRLRSTRTKESTKSREMFDMA